MPSAFLYFASHERASALRVPSTSMASLFTLRVCLPDGDDDGGTSDLTAGEPGDSGGTRSGTQTKGIDTIDTAPWRPLAFSAGNPCAEILHGELHLFRDTLSCCDEGPQGPTGTTMNGGDDSTLPKGRHPLVCVLAVPSSLSVGDFCRFAAALLPKVVEMRMVARGHESIDTGTDETTGNPNELNNNSRITSGSYSVILRFTDQAAADEFALNYHDKKFNAFAEETCKVLFVKKVEVFMGIEGSAGVPSVGTSQQTDSTENTGLIELPSCPVCLDRLDSEISGVVTTVCSHAFHASCIQNWEDNSCPVCRYTTDEDTVPRCGHPDCLRRGVDRSNSETNNLWACLICGSVGCGRYDDGKHALAHFHETNHCYAIELRTQRVWDYVRDGFVHRLIQSKTGLVELAPGAGGNGDGESRMFASPVRNRPTSSVDTTGTGSAKGNNGNGLNNGVSLDHGLGEYDSDYPLDPGLEEALVSSKLSHIHQEYSELLTNQLDEQRRYFEGVVAAAMEEKEGALSAAAAAFKQAEIIASAVRDAREARAELKSTKEELERYKIKVSNLEKEKEFLTSVNEQMTLNQRTLSTNASKEIESASSTAEANYLRIKDLEEQVRDLMVFLDAREFSGGGEGASGSQSSQSIQGGDVLGIAPPREVDGVDDAPSRSDVHARLQKKLQQRKQKRGG